MLITAIPGSTEVTLDSIKAGYKSELLEEARRLLYLPVLVNKATEILSERDDVVYGILVGDMSDDIFGHAADYLEFVKNPPRDMSLKDVKKGVEKKFRDKSYRDIDLCAVVSDKKSSESDRGIVAAEVKKRLKEVLSLSDKKEFVKEWIDDTDGFMGYDFRPEGIYGESKFFDTLDKQAAKISDFPTKLKYRNEKTEFVIEHPENLPIKKVLLGNEGSGRRVAIRPAFELDRMMEDILVNNRGVLIYESNPQETTKSAVSKIQEISGTPRTWKNHTEVFAEYVQNLVQIFPDEPDLLEAAKTYYSLATGNDPSHLTL